MIRPRPSAFIGRVSMRTTWTLVEHELRRVLDRDDAFGGGDAPRPSRTSRVDLPAPVPPEIRMFLRCWTASRRKSAICEREHPEAQHVRRAQAVPAEAPDGDGRPVDRRGRDRRVDAAPVAQAQVDHRRRLVDPAPRRASRGAR